MNVIVSSLAVSLALSSCVNSQYITTQKNDNTIKYSYYGNLSIDELYNNKQGGCIKLSSTAYAFNKNTVEVRNMAMDNRWQHIYSKNIKKLRYMKCLEDNWEDGAKCFSNTLIDKVIALIGKFTYFQPNVFPKYDSRIQLEFYDKDERYLQLVLSENTCELYYTDGINFDNDMFDEFKYDETYIEVCVSKFYGNNLYERTIRGTSY
jgi:hypothetical protein